MSGHNKLTESEVINRIKNVHGDNFDLSKVVYVNSKTKILIGCRNHKDTFWYETSPGPLFKGVGCPKCGVKKIWKTRKRVTTSEFIDKSLNKHGDRYDYSKSRYKSAKEKVIVICKIHGEYTITPNNHLNGKGCPKCGLIKSKKTRLKGLDYFITKSRLIHGDKYNYDHVEYVNDRHKVKIICPIHGEFHQSLGGHCSGRGCIECGHEYRSKYHPRKLTLEVVINRCKEIWGDLYDLSQIVDYKNTSSKVKIICTKHGEFSTTINQLLQGHGCYECGLDRISDSQRIDFEEFLEMKKDVWGDTYQVKKDDYKSYQSFRVYCKTHDFYWETIGSNFLKGHGCRHCGITVSKGETRIEEILKDKKIKFLEQHKFVGMEYKRVLRCDFYLPEYNLVIEYNGRQHYESIDFFGGIEGLRETRKRDRLKEQYCQENQINFEIIKYDEIVEDRLNQIILDYSSEYVP